MQGSARVPVQTRRQTNYSYPIILPKPSKLGAECVDHRGTGLNEPEEARPPLRQVVSQPSLTRAMTPHAVFSRHPPYTSTRTTTDSSFDEKLQSSFLTIDDAPTIITGTTPTSSPALQCSPFPPRSFTSYRPNNLTFKEKLPFSHYSPSCFPTNAWKVMWRSPEVNLDRHSLAIKVPNQQSQTAQSTTFRYETEFTGYAYRVIVDPAKCHSGIRIQTGTIVNVANINTDEGKYVVDVCQHIRDDLCFFPVHFREYDGQRFTSADDNRHYSFILVVPLLYSQVPTTTSPLLQKPLKSKPIRSFHPFVMIRLYTSSLLCCLTSKSHQESRNTTPRTSIEMDFRPPSSLQSRKSDYIFDITGDETASERGRKYAFWFARP